MTSSVGPVVLDSTVSSFLMHDRGPLPSHDGDFSGIPDLELIRAPQP